jgi:predicted DNA-binding transcriptional regulator AlpA
MKDADTSQAISRLLEAVQDVVAIVPRILDDSIARVLEKTAVATSEDSQTEHATRGTIVSNADRTRAVELRDAYLLGKLPDDGSLLVGKKEVSSLLNISSRTLSRLVDEKAMPNPIRLGNKVQWRLREIIEWVEADCPPQRYWNYSEGRGLNTRKKKGAR